MRILPYYILHTFVNSIKKLFRTWVAIMIIIIVGMGLVGGIVGGVVGSMVDDKESSDTSYSEENDSQNSFDGEKMSEEVKLEIIEMSVAGVTLLVILFNLYCGDKGGAKIFTMPDVNFLFPSPMKPQSILLFRTILQMGLALISSLYLIFQIPNLVLNLGFNVGLCFILLFTWFLILFLGKLTSVCTYTIAATKEKIRQYIRPFVILIIAGILGVFLYFYKFKNYSLFKSLVLLFASKQTRYIPIFGWIRGFVMTAADGKWMYTGIYLILLALASVLLTILIWKIKADFYEDALCNATELQERIDAQKSGKSATRKKDRSEKLERNGEIGGFGANVLLKKTIYNRKRFAKFGFFTPTSGTYILLALLLFVFVKYIVKAETLLPIGFVMLGAVFFRNLGNPIANETAHEYIYLIPESSFKKVFFTLSGGLYETALDTLPVMIISILVKQDILQIVLWYLLWLSFDLFCSSSGLFIELIIPKSVVTQIRAMLTMMLRMFAIMPSIILLIIGSFTMTSLMFILVFVINVGLSAILFAVSPRFMA